MSNNTLNKIKQFLPIILLPVIMIFLISFFVNDNNSQKDVTYYDIVEMFTNNEIEEYTLNLGSGVLEYKKRDSELKYKYTVPNINLFNQDVHAFVVQHNLTHDGEEEIIHNYKAGTSNSWITSLIPSVVLLVATTS